MSQFLTFLSSIPFVWQIIIFVVCFLIMAFFLKSLHDDLENYQGRAFSRDARKLVKQYMAHEISLGDVYEQRERLVDEHTRRLLVAIESSRRHEYNPFGISSKYARVESIKMEGEKDIESFINYHWNMIQDEESLKAKQTESDKKMAKILRAGQVLICVVSSVATVFVCGFAINFSKYISARNAESNAERDALNSRRESYTYYLDGEEVDKAKVDASQYQCSYDDTNECVYMTHREDRFILWWF